MNDKPADELTDFEPESVSDPSLETRSGEQDLESASPADLVEALHEE